MDGGPSGDEQLGIDARDSSEHPATGMPEAVVALWMPWAQNGVAVAAGVVVLLLVALGMALALRREMTDPPV